jgi:hypothetical protein
MADNKRPGDTPTLQPEPKFIPNPPAKIVAEALRNSERVVDQAKAK